jgi:lipopolysaccharide biosynthesis glycosyltransferase
MFELIKSLIDQSEQRMQNVIKQLKILKLTQRYQLQCLMLNHITNKMYELNNKAKKFWHYVKEDKESWTSHHDNERALKKAFSVFSDVINSIRKIKNTYEKTSRKINALWKSAEEMFAHEQFVQMLKSLRRCALRSMTIKNVRRVVRLIIENRLKNSAREISISRKSINRD